MKPSDIFPFLIPLAAGVMIGAGLTGTMMQFELNRVEAERDAIAKLYVELADQHNILGASRTETPHLSDGRWEVTQRWPGHPFVRWSWVWDGRKDEPTVHLEATENPAPKPPPAFIDDPDPDLEPGISPHNL